MECPLFASHASALAPAPFPKIGENCFLSLIPYFATVVAVAVVVVSVVLVMVVLGLRWTRSNHLPTDPARPTIVTFDAVVAVAAVARLMHLLCF